MRHWCLEESAFEHKVSMDNNTKLKKMVVCGVALVSLSAITPAPASAQVLGSGGCSSFISGSAGFSGACVQFEPGSQTHRVDFAGDHSFKVIANVIQTFYLEIESTSISPPGPTSRYPDPAGEECIPYVGATSTTPGLCALYDVRAFDENGVPIDPEDADQYFTGNIIYRVAWDHPTLEEFNPGTLYDNPRGLRAETSADPFFDITDGVFPTLVSGEDPGVDMSADGFSQYIIVQQDHGNALAGCLSPLNCSDPDDASLNVFNAGRTVPVKVVLNPEDPGADIRLTYTDPDGTPHLAEAAGNSNLGNKFRRTGNSFTFNWKTTGLAPGVYQLTIAPGTNSGHLFAPFTIMVTMQ